MGVYSQNRHNEWAKREIFTLWAGGKKSSTILQWLKNDKRSSLPFLQFVYSLHYVMIRKKITAKQCFLHS